jgi:SAM-dependent methyltransferase
MLNRNEKVLYNLKKDGIGIEIGPSYFPVAPKKAGYNVHIIDHTNRENLIEKYKDLDINIENIEEVDFIWKGESYDELTKKINFYDWIIASHVIEHTPNLIGFLNSCEKVLKNDGVLSLVVPDARFCFDYFRPESGLSKILDAHFQSHKKHSTGSIAEYNLRQTENNNLITWGEFVFSNDDYKLRVSAEKTAEMIKISLEDKEYLDCHAWCFTPSSFRLLIKDLNDLGFIKFKETFFSDSVGCEFFIHLSKNGEGCPKNRLELLHEIKIEQAKTINPKNLLKLGLNGLKEKSLLKYRGLKQKIKRKLFLK